MTTSRRFLLASSLARLVQRSKGGQRMIEGYFPDQDDRSSLVRIDGNMGFLVLTANGPSGHAEERFEVPCSHARALLDIATGAVEYIRTGLAIGSHEIQIDRFIRPGPLALVTMKLEPGEDAQAIYPLPWFGPEVTANPNYRRQQIALAGIPEIVELSVSNAVLNALLDVLESRFPAARARSDATGMAGSAVRLLAQPLSAESRAHAQGKSGETDSEDKLIRELAYKLRPQQR